MNTPVILLGHGSKSKESDAEFRQLVAEVRRLLPAGTISFAYLQLCEPDLRAEVAELVKEGHAEILIVPVFLFAGNHIREDIPALLTELEYEFPNIKLKLGRHLGPERGIAALVAGRIAESDGEFITEPQAIEAESFAWIERKLVGRGFSPAELELVKRVVHATADPDLAELVDIHPEAISAGIRALLAGKRIVTDVKMVAVGIGNLPEQRFGSRVECLIDDTDVAESAQVNGKTRAIQAIEKACNGMNGGIVAIGNAPTALVQLCVMIKAGEARPDLVVGVPVGFVGAAESKELLKNTQVPYIRLIGPRGGSPIAAALVHGLCKLAEEGQ
jgi:precorrin-8X/cobalt-precorrin-8 methylmutase